jgi:glycosyltransferase involved in cell wall biosynthesis
MISIAHVIAPAAFGGLERVVGGLAEAMVARGHRVVLVLILEATTPIPEWAQALEELDVIIEPIRLPSRAYAKERVAVTDVVRRHRIQVLHTHGYRSDVVHGHTARACGIPHISTVHGFTHNGWKGRLYEWLQLRALRRMDAVVAVSAPLEALLGKAGVPAQRIHRIINGPVRPLQAPLPRETARAQLDLDATGTIVGWVGRLSREKGPDLLVRTVEHLPHPVKVAVLGDGPMRSESSTAFALSVR